MWKSKRASESRGGSTLAGGARPPWAPTTLRAGFGRKIMLVT